MQRFTHTLHVRLAEVSIPVFREVIPISALHGVAIEGLKKAIVQLLLI